MTPQHKNSIVFNIFFECFYFPWKLLCLKQNNPDMENLITLKSIAEGGEFGYPHAQQFRISVGWATLKKIKVIVDLNIVNMLQNKFHKKHYIFRNERDLIKHDLLIKIILFD